MLTALGIADYPVVQGRLLLKSADFGVGACHCVSLVTLSLMEGVEARLAMDSRDSALRILLPSEEGGLSSTSPDSGKDAPRLLNTFGGGLKKKITFK